MSATDSRADPAVPAQDGSSADRYVGEEMSLAEHLEELRSRLFKSALAVAVGFAVGFALRDLVLDLLRRPYCALPEELRMQAELAGDGCRLLVLGALDPLIISVKAAAIVAVVLAAPIVCYQIWRFVTPGLRPIERRYAIPFLLASQLLFVAGAALSYFLLPRALEFLLGFAGEGLAPALSASQYISFVLQTVISFGVVFEFPLILIMLVLMGVVRAEGLRRARRYALFGTFVAAAIITPTQDPLTMTLMAGPLVLFYEVAILVARSVDRRRRKLEAGA